MSNLDRDIPGNLATPDSIQWMFSNGEGPDNEVELATDWDYSYKLLKILTS